jgi:hypothetical protein
MKVYPDKKFAKQQLSGEDQKDIVTKKVALAFAFVSVFYFFIKLLFL